MRIVKTTVFILSILFCSLFSEGRQTGHKRAMTFLDIIQMRDVQSQALQSISPDGKWFVYTITVPDWQKNRRFSDIYITPLSGGKTKQMTFTQDMNERLPTWYKDGSFFAFLSNRSEGKNQIYFMKPDEGQARKVTDVKDGVIRYQWSRNGKYLSYLSGGPEGRQIWIMPGKGGDAEKLTNHKTSVISYFWNPISDKIYFVAPDSIDILKKQRMEMGFDVMIQDEIIMPSHLWEIDVETKMEKQLTSGNEYSVPGMVGWNIAISEDGTKIAFIGSSTKRYASDNDNEVYLLDLKANSLSRKTNNSINEARIRLSPDSKWLAFLDGQTLTKLTIVPTEGGETKELLSKFNNDVWNYFWSKDNKHIYFNAQVGVDCRPFRVSIDDHRIEQITNFSGSVIFLNNEGDGKFIIEYSDPMNPNDYYYSETENIEDRSKWIRLTDANPQVKNFLLGQYETIKWKSTGNTTIEGLLIKPVNYENGVRYPLIVQLHGGPYDAYLNGFSGSWAEYVHVFAANGYVVFQPNYRGSSGYGEEYKKLEEVYLEPAFDDIMNGVDYLVDRGIVDPSRMGIMGFSAGGTLSNWALAKTDRFKAISSNAGGIRSNDLGQYENAKTPTLIQFGEYDPNVPTWHGKVLYKALKKLGVPTEFIVYPNMGHEISDMRYQMVKMQAEFNWFEKWIRGKEGWIDWKDMIETLKIIEK